jgi:hypothetical protein
VNGHVTSINEIASAAIKKENAINVNNSRFVLVLIYAIEETTLKKTAAIIPPT